MLDDLDQIVWDKLTGCYGPAGAVPGFIRDLASPSEGDRYEARSELMDHLCHQGQVSEATPPAVPFLVDLLRYGAVVEKDSLLDLLARIALSHSYHDAPQDTMLAGDPRHTAAFQRKVQQEQEWVRQAHDAVGAGLPLYLRLLDHEEADVRMNAASVLACFPEHAPTSVPRLQERLAMETVTAVRATILLALKLCMGAAEELVALLEQLLADESSCVRFVAALSLAHLHQEAMPQQAIDILVAVLGWPQEEELYHYRDSPLGGGLFQETLEALALLGADRAVPALGRALRGARYDDDALEISRVLLDFAFAASTALPVQKVRTVERDGRREILYGAEATVPRAAFTALTAHQRAVLRAIVGSDLVWSVETNLFAAYGLPASRGALRALLDMRT